MSAAGDTRWTNSSVRRLIESADVVGSADPVAVVTDRAQDVALKAMEDGWQGPPFDPFELASRLGVLVTPRSDVEDARLVVEDDTPVIEFNPNRRPARLRFTLAHELAHLLFEDYAHEVRERHRPDVRTSDTWQLEMLCNIAAAEFLMPAGSFPRERIDDLSLTHLVDVRSQFEVSTEAVLRRAIRLTERPAAMFVATREEQGGVSIDYATSSRAWALPSNLGWSPPPDSVLRQVTAVGFSVEAHESWAGHAVHVQAIGAPPYGGHRFPRIVGLLEPETTEGTESPAGITYVRGDATQPQRGGRDILAHVVNDQARAWGGRGFARALADRYPEVHSQYVAWTNAAGPQLGKIHWSETDDGLHVASMVAQAGYRDTGRQLLRVHALHDCLVELVAEAVRLDGTIHMPLIGTGYGGARWATIRDVVLDTVCSRGVAVRVYVLPEARMPDEAEPQLTLLG